MTRKRLIARLLAACLPCTLAACGVMNIGDIAAFLGPSVTVLIENDTPFSALPDLRTSESRNAVDDFFTEDEEVSHFSNSTAVMPNQTVTIRLSCDGDLELIEFRGAQFREGNGFPLGDVDAAVKLRRDSDFDCGDIIHIRLSGSVFNFYQDVEVEHTASGDFDDDDEDPDEEEDIADFLDDLFD